MKSQLRSFYLVVACVCSSAVAAQMAASREACDIALPASAYIQELAIDPIQSDVVYAATNGAGLFRSVNGAMSWKNITPRDARSVDKTQSYVVKIDPKNPSRIYTGGVDSGLWVSNDRGDTWQRAGLEGVTINDLAIDPTNSNRMFVHSYGGIYRTENITTGKWTLVFDYVRFNNNKPWRGPDDEPHVLSRFQKLSINPHNPKQIIAGVRWEGGIRISDDAGDTWRNEWISGMFRRVDVAIFHPSEAGVILAGTHHQGMYKSWNGGKSWVSLSRGLEPQKRTPYYNAYLIGGVAIDPKNADTLYTGSDYSNWKSIDGGVSWRELGRTLTCEFARTFAVDPQRPATVYAGTNVGVYKSDDGGETWAARNNGFPQREILQTTEIEIGDERFQYAVVKGQPAVYRRAFGCGSEGAEWQPMSWMLYTDASAISYDSARSELVLTTPGGEVRSADGGFRWEIPEVREATRIQPRTPASAADQQNKQNAAAEKADNAGLELAVDIIGNIFFDDSDVEPYYQRPPYVSLQIVTGDYPSDKSVPVFSANWDRSTRGKLLVPRSVFENANGKRLLLYVEVRDFHRGTLTGWAPLETRNIGESLTPSSVRVRVDTLMLLPSLSQR